MTYTKGTVIHIYGVSDSFGMTYHKELKATGATTIDGKAILTENKKGARKKFTLKDTFKSDQLLFTGEVPFKTDGETPTLKATGTGFTTSTIRMNACLNFTGDPAVIKDWIEHKNLNSAFTSYDYVVHVDGDKETPLYPEVPTSHAVIERMRNK